MGESTGDTEEKTCTNGAAESDELNVSRLEATLNISVLLGCLNIAIQFGSLTKGIALVVNEICDAVVRRLDTAYNVLILLRHLAGGRVGLTGGS